MTRLLLIRHAKAANARDGEGDFDRPLTPRGRRDAIRIADWMIASDLRPGMAICSAARRTRETLADLLPVLTDDGTVHLTRDLYEARPRAYLDAIKSIAGNQPLLVIGHNPAIHEVAVDLLADPTAGDGAVVPSFPTGSLAVIDFDLTDWRDITARSGRLAEFIRPRDLTTPDES